MDSNDKDLELVAKWKQTRNPIDFQNAYRAMSGTIYSASKKAMYGSNIPESVFKLRAVQQFHDTIETFDVEKGFRLNTKVYGDIENKLKRLNYKYSQIARIPERNKGKAGVYHVGPLQDSIDVLTQRFGRAPTDQEVGREMGYSAKEINSLKKDITKDYSMSGEVEDMFEMDDDSLNIDALSAVYYDLTPDQKKYYDLVTGQHGQTAVVKYTGAVDQVSIAKKMSKTPRELQKIRSDVASMMEKIR